MARRERPGRVDDALSVGVKMKSSYTVTVKSNKSGVALGRDGRGRLKCIYNKNRSVMFSAKTSIFGINNFSSARIFKK